MTFPIGIPLEDVARAVQQAADDLRGQGVQVYRLANTGNLALVLRGEQIGWIDFSDGTVRYLDAEGPETQPEG